MATLQGVTGTVSNSGQITSNGNFTCQYNDDGLYEVGYSAGLTNPVPVISLVGNSNPKSYTLETSTDGFSLQVWKLESSGWKKSKCAFDFIVAQIA